MHILSIEKQRLPNGYFNTTILNSELHQDFSQHTTIDKAIDKGIKVIKGELQIIALFQLEKFFKKTS